MIPFFIDFLPILDASWAPSWGYVGTMLAKETLSKSTSKKNSKKTFKNGTHAERQVFTENVEQKQLELLDCDLIQKRFYSQTKIN